MTTAQRDLLRLLLAAERPVGAAALGRQLHLSPWQVHYGLREIKSWLNRRHATLRHAPGVGVQVICSPEQRQRLLADLAAQARFQLVLTTEQRQQLLALALLTAIQPLTLAELQQSLAVARTTVLKDLDVIERCLARFDLAIARRQHRGCWAEGDELAKRQALAALLWGDVPFDAPIMSVAPDRGLVFVLAHDAGLLPIVGQASALVRELDMAAAYELIALAEADLGGRFSDEAVAPLALGLAIQAQRVRVRQYVGWDDEALGWIQSQAAWPTAARHCARLWPDLPEGQRAAETAQLALLLLTSARDEPWPGDRTAATGTLVDQLQAHIAAAYAAPELTRDQLLRDGLEALIPPACVRQRFRLWAPPKTIADIHTERYADERAVAAQLAEEIERASGAGLPPDTIDELVLLLRAAVVRARPEQSRHVLVVCPSGMATTQLLVARLRARFPRLGTFEVLPMRELTAARAAGADLIITTVPLVLPEPALVDIIHVHPMLRPDDIAALTQWMA